MNELDQELINVIKDAYSESVSEIPNFIWKTNEEAIQWYRTISTNCKSRSEIIDAIRQKTKLESVSEEKLLIIIFTINELEDYLFPQVKIFGIIRRYGFCLDKKLIEDINKTFSDCKIIQDKGRTRQVVKGIFDKKEVCIKLTDTRYPKNEEEILHKIKEIKNVPIILKDFEPVSGWHGFIMPWYEHQNIKNLYHLHKLVHSLLSTLTLIHEKQLIHGDLKSSNVICLESEIVIIDFEHTVNVGQLIKGGTMKYLPPERLWLHDDTARFSTDYWGAGLTILSWMGNLNIPNEPIDAIMETVGISFGPHSEKWDNTYFCDYHKIPEKFKDENLLFIVRNLIKWKFIERKLILNKKETRDLHFYFKKELN